MPLLSFARRIPGLSRLAGGDARMATSGYDAIEEKKRRKPASGVTQSEDKVLDQSGRRKLTSNAQDIRRNFTIAAWMIRRHLDFVSQFEFHARTDDEGFNRDLESLMQWWYRPANCDAAGRHPFPKLVRLAEASRTVDGDVGVLTVADGTLQGIEGDRIRNPSGADAVAAGATRWVHGVKVNEAGRALAYGIHRRVDGGSAMQFERTVPSSRMFLHGHFDRFDQVRGVSPIAAALNPLRDVYENFDYALARAKVSQLFALAITQGAIDDGSDGEVVTGEDADGDGQEDKYSVDFGRGPMRLLLDPGDDAKFLDSKSPAAEFQAFNQLVIAVALKALDIPYNFYDEAHTNFFGSRAAWLLYDRACRDKRADVAELLRKISVWRLALFVQDRVITLPSRTTLGSLKFEWVPTGMPWWDQSKEIRGDLMAISAGLDTPQRICKERGRGEFQDNVLEIAKALKFAQDHEVTLSFDPGQPETVVEVAGGGAK